MINFSEASRREGLLSLEEHLDRSLIKERDPLMVGLQLVIDGTDAEVITRIFDNYLEADCPSYGYERIILKGIKTGVLSIQEGTNTRVLKILLDSVCPIDVRPNMFLEEEK
jgi:flagellar motor component MotA